MIAHDMKAMIINKGNNGKKIGYNDENRVHIKNVLKNDNTMQKIKY